MRRYSPRPQDPYSKQSHVAAQQTPSPRAPAAPGACKAPRVRSEAPSGTHRGAAPKNLRGQPPSKAVPRTTPPAPARPQHFPLRKFPPILTPSRRSDGKERFLSGVKSAPFPFSLLPFCLNCGQKSAEGCEKARRAGSRGGTFQISPLLTSRGRLSPQLLLPFATLSLTQTPFISACRSFLPEKKRNCKNFFFQTEADPRKRSVQHSRKGFPALPLLPPLGLPCSEASAAPVPRRTRRQSPNSVAVRTESLAWSTATRKSPLKRLFLIHFSYVDTTLNFGGAHGARGHLFHFQGYFCSAPNRSFSAQNEFCFVFRFLSNRKNKQGQQTRGAASVKRSKPAPPGREARRNVPSPASLPSLTTRLVSSGLQCSHAGVFWSPTT